MWMFPCWAHGTKIQEISFLLSVSRAHDMKGLACRPLSPEPFSWSSRGENVDNQHYPVTLKSQPVWTCWLPDVPPAPDLTRKNVSLGRYGGLKLTLCWALHEWLTVDGVKVQHALHPLHYFHHPLFLHPPSASPSGPDFVDWNRHTGPSRTPVFLSKKQKNPQQRVGGF